MTSRFNTRLAALAAAVSVVALAAGAHAQELSLEGRTIGITAVGTDHHWDLMAYQGMIDEIEALGGEAIALDAQRSDQTQISHIQTLIAQEPDAILQMLGNIDVLDPWLERVVEAGIPLFTVDTVTPHAINNTTSNNYAIGVDVALQLVADIGGEGNILVFNGFQSVPVCRIRYDMLRYVLEDYPGVQIIEPELRDVIPNTVQSAYSDVTDMLTRYPNDGDISAVWACWDIPQVGAAQAIEAAGRAGIGTYSIDGDPQIIAMIADPDSAAAASAAQQPYEIGRTAARNVAAYLAGETVPPFTFVPHVLVTKANAHETAAQFLEE